MAFKSSPPTDLLLSVVVPSFILMKFSGGDALGATGALVVALAFPVSLGLYELLRFRSTNYIAVLGLVGVLLTGGIGLLQLDAHWLAVKEAAVPAVLGTALIVSAWLGYPLLKTLLYNPKFVNTENTSRVLRERGSYAAFQARLVKATYLLGGTFFFSAAMNYLLTTWVVTSPAGSAAFNEQLGRLTLISYPVIAIPSMLMTLAILYFLWRSLQGYTGLKLEKVVVPLIAGDK